MQFDVFLNPILRARRAFPLVAALQSDLADTGRDRIVAFMVPESGMATVTGRLMPVVAVDQQRYVLLVPSLTNLPATDLTAAVGNIAADRDRIVAALDWLFLGV